MVYGVILGAAMHLLIQVPGLVHYGFRWRPVIGLKTPGVLRVLILLWPRVLTMASIQAYFVARDSLASRFGGAGVGALNLGWTIEQVPETVIGTAIAIALLPTLAEFINGGQADAFRETVNRALRVMLALSLPAAALLAVGIRPLVAGFFGYETAQLNLVTWCTWAFLFGLLGDTWLETAVRSFYANQNTRTPLVAAFIQAVSFFLLAWLFSRLDRPAGHPAGCGHHFHLAGHRFALSPGPQIPRPAEAGWHPRPCCACGHRRWAGRLCRDALPAALACIGRAGLPWQPVPLPPFRSSGRKSGFYFACNLGV